MARGQESKKIVENKILEVFPNAFINDKKIYIDFVENGEPLQICVSMTCPKTTVSGGSSAPTAVSNGGIDFDAYLQKKPTTEFTPEEKKTIELLLDRL